MARSGGICQFCGQREATDAHHWASSYCAEEEVTEDDLTALCRPCHDIATALRGFARTGGSIHRFSKQFKATMSSMEAL